ncbi:MAG: sulfatase-like hydrolase/transferase, partial [Planctomycetota bacterium]|nr:sulfatase-like hydrolase/transferase [Planctomycetota bacterium]
MRQLFVVLITLLIFRPAVADKKPNFIVVFCDDLGYADIGPFGSKTHDTPVLDKMAREGMKLTDF